jgi:hypothetical protein
LADGKGFSIPREEKSWEFMLVGPMFLCSVSKLHFGDDLIIEIELLLITRNSILFLTWNRIQVMGGRAATVAWIVRCDRSHDQIPLLILERPIEKSTFHVTSPFSVTGLVKSNKSKAILTIFYTLDDDLMTLDRLVTGLHSGEHFCEIVERELMNIATNFSFYAIDDDGTISSPISLTVVISANNMNDHFVSQSNDIVPMISRDISPSVTNNDREGNSLFHSNNNSRSDQRQISSHAVTFAGDSLLSMRFGVAKDTLSNFDIWGLSGSTKYSLTGCPSLCMLQFSRT